MIGKVLLAVLGLIAGVLCALFYQGVPITNFFTGPQSLFTQIQGAWANLPDLAKTVIVTGIPAAIVTFMAWTKSRAMQKLQQVQQEATLQIGQMEGEKFEALQNNLSVQQRNVQLEQQIAGLQQANRNATALQEANTNLQKQVEKLMLEKSEAERLFGDKYVEQVKKAIEESKRLP